MVLTSNITFLYFWFQDVQNLFAAVVKLLDSGDIIRLDQEDLETVIPALGTVDVPWVHVLMNSGILSLLKPDSSTFISLTPTQISLCCLFLSTLM